VNKKSNGTLVAILMYVAMGILSFILVGQIFVFVENINYKLYDYEVSTNNYIYSFKDGRYVDTLENYYMESTREIRNPEKLECMAVSEYYVAASVYRAYMDDAAKGEKYYEKMQDARSRMKDFAYMADDIDERLGITF